jgi:phosphatidylethanolamine/phosphatidyl-N-methylethanolamine N-methyltransferase
MERPPGADFEQSSETTSRASTAKSDAATPVNTVTGDDVRSAYARWAPVYSVLASPTIMGRIRAAKRMNTLSGRILEAGVGTGSALPLYDRKLEVVGVDLSHDMLKRARQRIAEERLHHVRGVYEMDLMQLAFADATFDAAVCMFTITAVPHPGQVMEELGRVVRPGGVVLIASHFRARRGPWRVTDKLSTPFARKLGWDPAMDRERVLGASRLILESEELLPPMGLVDLLTFRRI